MLLHEYLDGIQFIIEGYSQACLILASDLSSDFRTEKIGIIRDTIDFRWQTLSYFGLSIMTDIDIQDFLCLANPTFT
jgi:hypothetical protein